MFFLCVCVFAFFASVVCFFSKGGGGVGERRRSSNSPPSLPSRVFLLSLPFFLQKEKKIIIQFPQQKTTTKNAPSTLDHLATILHPRPPLPPSLPRQLS